MVFNILGITKNLMSIGRIIAKITSGYPGQQVSNSLIKLLFNQFYAFLMGQDVNCSLRLHRRRRKRHLDDEEFAMMQEALRATKKPRKSESLAYFAREFRKNILTFDGGTLAHTFTSQQEKLSLSGPCARAI